MKNSRGPIKIGLLGTTGVGKDTCVNIIKNTYSDLSFHIIRLADPLYQAQDAIYSICNKTKLFYNQDGELLNFLGLHMRKIDPDVLKKSFLTTLQNSDPSIDCIICPDVRSADVTFVKDAGFIIIYIDAEPKLTIERRKARGDVSLGKIDHETEKGINQSTYDYRLSNNDTLEDFQQNVKNLISQLML